MLFRIYSVHISQNSHQKDLFSPPLQIQVSKIIIN